MSEFLINDQKVSSTKILEIIRKNGQILSIIRDLIIDSELSIIELKPELEEELIKKFREDNKLTSEDEYHEYLNSRHLDEALLKQMVTRPNRIVQYREERWGPRAKSLYLQHKDNYDLVTYFRLQCNNSDVMQEVYFRIKDKEESWESLNMQFQVKNRGYELGQYRCVL